MGQEWQILFWSRFRRESLNSAISRKRLRDLLLHNFVSTSVRAPCSHRDVVERIAADARMPIPIDYLCSELGDKVFSRGRAVFGSPGKYFDEIAQNYPGLHWWLSDRGLRMEILRGNGRLPSFDELAGHLMFQARSNRNEKHLKQSNYEAIAEEIDKAGFPVLKHLPRQYRKMLALWNQKHPGQKIKTFRDAIQAKQPRDLRRGVLRCLYYAEEKVRDGTF